MHGGEQRDGQALAVSRAVSCTFRILSESDRGVNVMVNVFRVRHKLSLAQLPPVTSLTQDGIGLTPHPRTPHDSTAHAATQQATRMRTATQEEEKHKRRTTMASGGWHGDGDGDGLGRAY